MCHVVQTILPPDKLAFIKLTHMKNEGNNIFYKAAEIKQLK